MCVWVQSPMAERPVRFQPLQGSVESIRGPAIAFAVIDVVPQLAARETHQRS
jgi:hypothetical protein